MSDLKKQYKNFRLRRGNQIVAYAQEKSTGVSFTGKYLLFWRAGEQGFDEIDEATSSLDKMNCRIYEGDIVRYKSNFKPLFREAVIIKKSNDFFLLDLDFWAVIPLHINGLSLFQAEALEITSHQFTHPDLNQKIKSWKKASIT